MGNPIIIKNPKTYDHQPLLTEECKHIFENNASIMLILDPDSGRIIDANKSAVDFYKYPKDKLLRMTIYEINILTQEEILARINNVKNKEKDSFIFNHKLADNSIKTVRVHSSKINIKNKLYLFSVIFDNTEYLQLENHNLEVNKQLKDSLIFNQNLIKNASEGIIVYDRDLRYTIWNNFMARTTGLQASEVIGKRTTEIFSQGTYSEVTNGLERALKGETVTLESIEFINSKTQESGFTREVYSPNYDSEGKIIGVVCIISDVTNIVKYQKSLAKKNKELEELNKTLSHKMQELEIAKEKAEESDRLKSAFLAHISHEIRTPLNLIVGFSNLLKDAVDQDTIAKHLNIINTNNLYLINIIENTLTYALIESNSLTMNISKIDIISMLKHIFRDFRQMETDRVKLKLTTKDIQQLFVTTDESKLTQIIGNFLTNAHKFTNSGEVEFGIDSYNSEQITIFVRDTGIGIEQEHHEKIFESFFKQDNLRPGSGLGLTLCKSLSELLTGKITFESHTDEGSTFYLELPLNFINQGENNDKQESNFGC